MPIAIMVYNLPEEQGDLDEVRRAGSYHNALSDVWNKLRSKLKYEDISETEQEVYDQVKQWVCDACETWDVEIP